MEFTYFVGVDVSKNELDLAVYNDKKLLYHKEIANNQEETSQLIKKLKKLEGMTTSYSRGWLTGWDVTPYLRISGMSWSFRG